MSARRSTARRPAGLRAALLLLPLLAVGGGLWLDARGDPVAAIETAGGAAAPAPEAAGAPVATAMRQPLPAPPDPPAASFDDYVERLVAIGVATIGALDAGDGAGAQQHDAAARSLLAELLRKVPDPAGRALFHLTGLLAEDTTTAGQVRRRVCVTILELTLDELHRTGAHARVEQLVRDLLATIPQEEAFADELGRGLLVDRPWVGTAHEAQILELAALADRSPRLAELASALLLTLWQNLEAGGARTPEQLAGIALLGQEDPAAAIRLASACKLATVQGGRWRDLVVDTIWRTRDTRLAPAVAQQLAAAAPPQVALAALGRLLPLLGTHASAPFLALAGRDARPLADGYEQRLAAGTDAPLRAELVTGAGFAGGARGVALARLAIDADPDPEVRIRALFVLSAQGGTEAAERALAQALDDPAVQRDPRRLGQVVLAFENLARGGDPNATARIGRRLQARQELLSQGDRATLGELLARYLPR
jgi:hypothetical protein